MLYFCYFLFNIFKPRLTTRKPWKPNHKGGDIVIRNLFSKEHKILQILFAEFLKCVFCALLLARNGSTVCNDEKKGANWAQWRSKGKLSKPRGSARTPRGLFWPPSFCVPDLWGRGQAALGPTAMITFLALSSRFFTEFTDCNWLNCTQLWTFNMNTRKNHHQRTCVSK